MDNYEEDNFQWLNKIESRSLRELSYLLCKENLKHPLIAKDLYYPSFESNGEGQYGLQFYSELSQSQAKQLNLVDHLTALGRYAERLLAAWFMINPNFDLLAFNHQLIEEGTTLGEIDFLLWEKVNRRAIHLEFALKYYLAYEENGKTKFIGPKGRDTLEGKSRKLVEHQLRLSKDHSELLEKELSSYEFISKLLLKGFIFQPYGSRNNYVWIKQKDIENSEIDQSAECYIMANRRDWIYPFDPALMQNSMTVDDFKEELLRTENIPLLCLIKKENASKILLMVVADHWPQEEVN